MPDLEFNWLRAFLLSIVVCFGGFGAIVGLLLLVPPMISVNRHGVSRQQGQSAYWLRRADIRRIIIDLSDSERPVLRVESSKQPWQAGIAPKVRPEQLADIAKVILPEILMETIGNGSPPPNATPTPTKSPADCRS